MDVFAVSVLPKRPKKPTRPRPPREVFRRFETVWSSEEEDILLADLLHLIPSDVKAQNVRINVEKNPVNGYPYVTVTYEHDIINTRYSEQLRDYDERLKRYESDIAEWLEKDALWLLSKHAQDDELAQLRNVVETAYNDHMKDVI